MSGYRRLIDGLGRSLNLSPQIVQAFLETDRIRFLPQGTGRAEAYADHPVRIGHRQTNSQPYTVAFMLQLLDPRPNNNVLDIGSGSGWTTALLARLIAPGKVNGTERIPELVQFGRQNLAREGIVNAEIHLATSRLGLPGQRFDRILVSASAPSFPTDLVDQMPPGGILVLPCGSSILRVCKTEDGFQTNEFPGFVFVPLLPGADE